MVRRLLLGGEERRCDLHLSVAAQVQEEPQLHPDMMRIWVGVVGERWLWFLIGRFDDLTFWLGG